MKELWRIVVSAAIFVLAFFAGDVIAPVLFVLSYLIVGGEVLVKAFSNIIHGKLLDENFLMSIATIGAFFIGEYPEAVAVMLLYQVGELFQDYASDKSRRSITALMELRPDSANVKRDGKISAVTPEEVAVGEVIVVSPGERLPLDGIILQGEAMLDTSAITGEPRPRSVSAGDEVLSGYVNQTGVLEIQVTKPFSESTVNKILKLVESADERKSKSESYITRFAEIYTPVVVGAAVLLAVIPPLVIGSGWSDWLYRALNFLVVSCPCALVISIPLSFFGGIGGASRAGILVKGANYLEALSETEIVAFDKTGTMTEGVFEVQELHPVGISKQELLYYAAHAECYSKHPIAQSVMRAYGSMPDKDAVKDYRETAGFGVDAIINGHRICAGNGQMLERQGISGWERNASGTVVHISVDGNYAGYIVIADRLKDDAVTAVRELRKAGVKRIVMLTGDSEAGTRNIAEALGVSEVYSGLLPEDKARKMDELLSGLTPGGKLAFVGDGINDAPVLAGADIGIAMGGLGADAAIEAADVVLMTDEPSKLVTGIKISKRTRRIVRQNVIAVLGVKVCVLALSALGITGLWMAVFADVGISILAVLNSMRTLMTVKQD